MPFRKTGWIISIGALCLCVMTSGGSHSCIFAEAGQAVGIVGNNGSSKHFDVASVRQNTTDERSTSLFPLAAGDAFAQVHGHFRATHVLLLYYISFAYKLSSSQIADLEDHAPSLLNESYDIDARTDDVSASKDDMREMMKALLAERFKLSIHVETKGMPVYDLVVATPNRLGAQLRIHPAELPCAPDSLSDGGKGSESAFSVVSGGSFPRSCGGVAENLTPAKQGCRRAGGRSVGMPLLAKSLPRMGALELPVVDHTELKGVVDFILEWQPEQQYPVDMTGNRQNQPVPAPSESNCPSFEDALRTQLGLKLIKSKADVQMYVVDHVEHPTPN